MRVVVIAAAIAGVLVPLAGCQSSASTGGTAVASIGAEPGTLSGGLAGNMIGRDLDATDRRAALSAEFRALEYGQTGASTPWSNTRTGHYGSVVPGTAYKLNDTTCREFNHTLYVDGRSESARGTACRTPDGGWRTVG